MFTKTLVPLDSTEHSEEIIPFVTQLAQRLQMEVVLATSVDLDHRSGNLFGRLRGRSRRLGASSSQVVPSQTREAIEGVARSRLDRIVDRMTDEDVQAESMVGFGPPSQTIISMATDSGCDLISMFTRGRGVLISGLVGSVMYRTMHESPVPLLAVTPESAELHRESGHQISRVIAPLDGSELAEAVLPYIAALCRRMDVGVTLLYVVPQYELIYSESVFPTGDGDDPKAVVREEAAEYLDDIAGQLEVDGIDVDVTLLNGRASTVIADVAHGVDHSMIAMATHGRSGLSRLVIGSIAEEVVRTASNPILMVRSQTTDTP